MTLADFEKTVARTIERYRMFDGCERAVVGVSGGPDSTALLYALARLGGLGHVIPELVVAHLDHDLRGEASREDARFVERVAARLELDFVAERVDVARLAADARRNLEAQARDARYDFFARAASERGARCVATGHTASDQAETVLMRLARGAGVDGLAGTAAVRPLIEEGGARLVRPLIAATREEVLAYCREREIPFRVDATNADTRRARARLRADVLPALEALSPGAARNLARAAFHAAEDRAYFAGRVDEIFRAWSLPELGEIRLPVAELATLDAALRRRVLREAVRRARGDLLRLTAEHVEALDRLAGERVDRGGPAPRAELPRGVRARREGPFLVVEREGARESG